MSNKWWWCSKSMSSRDNKECSKTSNVKTKSSDSKKWCRDSHPTLSFMQISSTTPTCYLLTCTWTNLLLTITTMLATYHNTSTCTITCKITLAKMISKAILTKGKNYLETPLNSISQPRISCLPTIQEYSSSLGQCKDLNHSLICYQCRFSRRVSTEEMDITDITNPTFKETFP